MKKIHFLFVGLLLLTLFGNFQCSNQNDQDTAAIAAEMQVKKQAILQLIQSTPCNESGCSAIGFGEKPCGGFWEFLRYPNQINLQQLTQLVEEYNNLNKQYNILTNAVSDCMAVMPPAEINCVNGTCE